VKVVPLHGFGGAKTNVNGNGSGPSQEAVGKVEKELEWDHSSM